MEIKMLELIEGAKQATGLTVIIDVFRAFSTACYVFRNGAEKIFPIGDIELAYQLKKEHPDYILMGERGGIMQPGFDYGNSPTRIEHVDFSGLTIVQTTSAGTQGFANAHKADEMISGSFVNAGAIVKYIKRKKPAVVSLVSMGSAGTVPNDEDRLLAEYLKSQLSGNSVDFTKIKDHLRNYDSARKFFDPTIEWAPEKDFELCMNLNAVDFILRAEKFDDNLICLKKVATDRIK